MPDDGQIKGADLEPGNLFRWDPGGPIGIVLGVGDRYLEAIVWEEAPGYTFNEKQHYDATFEDTLYRGPTLKSF